MAVFSAENRAVIGAAMIFRGGAVLAESVADILDRVHRETSPAMGQLCVALEKRKVRPETLRAWASSLSRGAQDLLRLAEQMDKGRK